MAKLRERSPFSSMLISSPGATSRTNEAPTMSSAAVSLATTQPLSSRPSTSGRTPCGSRAAYRVSSSMKTRQKAPRSRGSTCIAASSVLEPGNVAISAVISAVSVVASESSEPGTSESPSTSRSASQDCSSRVLVRLPLWPSERPPVAVERKVGCAFCQTLAPVVE